METKNIKVTAKVIGTSYKSTSVNGNPSYWVSFEAENGIVRAYTASDASCGYGCTNFNGEMCDIVYHLTRSGNAVITSMNKPK